VIDGWLVQRQWTALLEVTGMDAWIQNEVDGCAFGDRRLDQRFGKLLGSLSERMGKALPLACQDWAGTKAAYRFLNNPRVDEGAILAGHFQATRARFAESEGLVLVLHDTTELSYQRTSTEPIGKVRKTVAGRHRDGRPRLHTICGLLMHSSLVVTTEGLPLGLAAIKFWTRKKFKGTNALRRKINPTRVPIEEKESHRWVENLKQATDLLGDSQRCVHVGDRESDIFELFCAADGKSTNFLVRTCVDRLAEQGNITVADLMKKADRGIHCVELTDRHGKPFRAELEVRFGRMTILPPVGKQKRYPALSLTVIHARETHCPKDRERIDWRLLTNLPVACLQEAIDKLDWYAMRWRIETFHKILKSGCKAEEAKLRTAQRLTNLIAIYCIVSWRIFWLCMINRTVPDAAASLVFTEVEMQLLDRIDPKPPSSPDTSVSRYLQAVARLGGYLSRARDLPPGNIVIWRGFTRLIDIHLGFCLATQLVGN
jgi:hypothetical protein